MRRTFSQVIASLLVIALVAPAASVAAQEIQRPASPAVAPTVAQPVSIATAISRAITTSQGTEQSPVAGKVNTRGLRMQGYGGGGGKGPLIMGLVSAAVGVVGMMYMLKYLKDQQKQTETVTSRIR